MLRSRILLSHSLLLSFLTPTGFLCLVCFPLLSSFSTTLFLDCSLSISSVSFAVFSFININVFIVLNEKFYTNCPVTILKLLSLGCFLSGRTLLFLEKLERLVNRAMSYHVHSFYFDVWMAPEIFFPVCLFIATISTVQTESLWKFPIQGTTYFHPILTAARTRHCFLSIDNWKFLNFYLDCVLCWIDRVVFCLTK